MRTMIETEAAPYRVTLADLVATTGVCTHCEWRGTPSVAFRPGLAPERDLSGLPAELRAILAPARRLDQRPTCDRCRFHTAMRSVTSPAWSNVPMKVAPINPVVGWRMNLPDNPTGHDSLTDTFIGWAARSTNHPGQRPCGPGLFDVGIVAITAPALEALIESGLASGQTEPTMCAADKYGPPIEYWTGRHASGEWDDGRYSYPGQGEFTSSILAPRAVRNAVTIARGDGEIFSTSEVLPGQTLRFWSLLLSGKSPLTIVSHAAERIGPDS